MTASPRLPLLGKMILWLFLHFLLLVAIAAGLAFWQYRSGLDALLRSPAGDRLRIRGEQMAAQLRDLPRSQWPQVIEALNSEFSVKSDLWMPHGAFLNRSFKTIPPRLEERLHMESGNRAQGSPPPRPDRPNNPGRPPIFDDPFHDSPPPHHPQGSDRPPPRDREFVDDRPPPQAFRPVTPLIFIPHEHYYWVAMHLPLQPGQRPDHVTWVIQSQQFGGNGLFFDFSPLLLAVAGILFVSVLFWIPFAFHITRYLKKLQIATEQIATGDFEVKLGSKRKDELGSLGLAITAMAQRIDQLLRGQKRFLGDVAHELCSPLVRLRTGLSILEHKLPQNEKHRLESIEDDAQELATLIDELLDFTRSSTVINNTKLTPLLLAPIIDHCRNKEIPDHPYDTIIPADCLVLGDDRLLKRAIGNIFRNIHRHAGKLSAVTIRAELQPDTITITVSDNGPGVPLGEHERIFEPFYRVDVSRTRETGGTGLGLAIVRNCLLACAGSIRIQPHSGSGLHLNITLKRP